MSAELDLERAIQVIQQRSPSYAPKIGLILGSGLGSLADSIEHAVCIPYREIPSFPTSKVAGHVGNLVIGSYAGKTVIAMQGRAHLYEGWSASRATFPIRCMRALGVETLIVSNASGGIQQRFSSGQVVLIDAHIDWMHRPAIDVQSSLSNVQELSVPNRGTPLYDPELLCLAERSALKLDFALSRGTYLATLGPNYETRAEYRAFAKMGADMVGMSTVPEVLLAHHLGMRVLAFSIVTNVAKPDAPTVTDHQQVLDWSRNAQGQLIPLIAEIVRTM